MNILFDGRLLLNSVSGIGYYIRNLLEKLIEIDPVNNYTVLLNNSLSNEHPFFKLKAPNLKIRILDVPEFGMKNQVLFPLKVRGKSYDIFHYPHFDLPLLSRIPSVITIHDLKYILHPDFFSGSNFAKQFYIKNIMKIALKKAHKILTVSDTTKKDIIKYFRVEPDKIKTVHLSVDSKFKKMNKTGTLKQLLEQNRVSNDYFLCIGERRPHKNLVRVIQAFEIYRNKTGVDEDLVIIGKPYSNYTEPEEYIENNSLTEVVKIIGYVNDEELLTYYNNCKALVFASLYEGFGIPVLEAFACEVPVIISNIGSLPEIAAQAALKVNPHDPQDIADAMQKIHQDPNLRRGLIQEGINRLKKFNWQNSAAQTLAVYQEVYENASCI